jgi:hypothetical protein
MQNAVAPTRLASALAELGPDVSPEEAGRLAEMAMNTSAELAVEYGAHRPAWLNNMLVNAGVRERGLCYHWATDLFARLQPDHYQTLELHSAVARIKTSREHNAIVVTARGQAFQDGIVLDPWRECGRLYWGNVAQDRYPWVPRPPDPP